MTSSDDYPPEKPQHPKEYTPGGFVASNPFADQPAYVPPSGPPPAYRPGDASAYAPPQAANSEPTSLPGYQPPSGVQASSYPLSEQEQKSWVSDSKNAVPQPPRDAPSYPSPSSSSSLQAPPSGTANPSSSSSTGFRSRFLVGSSSSNELFNPPPACFTRPPPHNPLMSSPFPPCSLLSIDSRLDNGFPTIPPPSSLQPHPFIIHDVTEEDWTRLLSDVKNAGRSLSSSSSSSSNSLGPLTHLPVVGLLLRASQSVVNNSSSSNNNNNNNRNLVRDMIDHWNHYFFYPRQLELTLAQGNIVHAGPAPPPDTRRSRSAHDRSDSASSSSSDSSDSGRRHPRAGGSSNVGVGVGGRREYRDDRRQMKRERREERRARKYERREMKRERREERWERRHGVASRGYAGDARDVSDEKWRLVVSFRPHAV